LQVLVRDNNVDQALRVLKKKMQREGIFREMKRRSSYEKPSERANREKSEAVRRQRKLARKKAQRDGLIAAPKKKVLPGRGPGLRPGMGADRPRHSFCRSKVDAPSFTLTAHFPRDRRMLFTANAGFPDFSAISRSCSSITVRAGASPSSPPRISLGIRRLDRWVPSS
jgi:small subunit ribosomal protein S21